MLDAPLLSLCRCIALACLLQREAPGAREPCSSPRSCHPSTPRGLCMGTGTWHRMCPGSSGHCAEVGARRSSGLLNSPGVLDQQVSFYPLFFWFFFVFGVKQTGWSCWGSGAKARSARPWWQPGAPCGTWLCRTAVPAVLVTVPSLLYVSLLSLLCPHLCWLPLFLLLSEGKEMPIRQWTCPTCTLAREGSTCRAPVWSQQYPGNWEEGASLGQTSSMGNTGRKIVMV